MRADQVVQGMAPETLSEAMRLWAVPPEQGREALVRAMRANDAWARVRGKIRAQATREAIARVCADPSAPIEALSPKVELALQQLGLIGRGADGAIVANLDLALALVSAFPLEYGAAQTLVARLGVDDLQTFARALDVSPHTHHIDRVIAVARAWSDPALLSRKVAPLSVDDRQVLAQTLALAPMAEAGIGEEVPLVQVFTGSAGLRALVLRVSWPSGESRLVVAREAAPVLAQLIQTLPSVEAVNRRARKPAATGVTARPKASPKLDVPAPPEVFPELVTRTAQVLPASAVVDVGGEGALRFLRENWELWSEVATTFDRRRVVLKEGVDAERWAGRAAVALADGGTRGDI